MSLEFRGEVWTKYINLGVIRLEMIFKAGKLGEIIKGVGVDRKEEGLRTEPRAGSNSLLPKSLLQLPRLIHRKPVSPIYWSSSCFIKPRHDLPVGTNSKMTNARKA